MGVRRYVQCNSEKEGCADRGTERDLKGGTTLEGGQKEREC